MGMEYKSKEVQESILDVHITEAGYEPGQSTIRNIRMSVARGELVGIIGPKWCGQKYHNQNASWSSGTCEL